MGYYRTGSTLLFNVARLWAALASDAGTMTGFNCFARTGTETEKKKSKCTIICKDHVFKESIKSTADTVLMSRRDPFESVCSRKMMDQWCKEPPKGSTEDAQKWHMSCKNSA